MTVAQAIRDAAAQLAATSDTARLDAEVLMAQALGVSRSRLLVSHMRDPVPAGFAALIARRQSHEPVAYICGEQEFFGLSFRVSPAVLIPRADSETLVAAALAAAPDARSVLDCGTGSGALLLAALAHLPQARGVGVDRSAAALAVAQDNAELLSLSERATLRLADWDQPDWRAALPAPFDLILANPPYVETGAALDASVRAFEPGGALFAGADGLDAYHVLVPQLATLLDAQGVALVEIGWTQADAVAAIGAEAGLTAQIHADLGGRPRALEFRRQ